jgi:hypothetical protein
MGIGESNAEHTRGWGRRGDSLAHEGDLPLKFAHLRCRAPLIPTSTIWYAVYILACQGVIPTWEMGITTLIDVLL